MVIVTGVFLQTRSMSNEYGLFAVPLSTCWWLDQRALAEVCVFQENFLLPLLIICVEIPLHEDDPMQRCEAVSLQFPLM